MNFKYRFRQIRLGLKLIFGRLIVYDNQTEAIKFLKRMSKQKNFTVIDDLSWGPVAEIDLNKVKKMMFDEGKIINQEKTKEENKAG